jgi:hypothetical protein
LNSGPPKHKADAPLLEPHPRAILLCLLWRWGVGNSFPGLASASEQLGSQARGIERLLYTRPQDAEAGFSVWGGGGHGELGKQTEPKSPTNLNAVEDRGAAGRGALAPGVPSTTKAKAKPSPWL